nr:U3 small nucleolar RNA associated protein 18 [Hymenolepis microstoma]
MAFSDEDSEFSIVVHPKKFNELDASITKPIDVANEPELNPAWVDDEDNTLNENNVLGQPTILDIHSHVARKRQRISEVEKLFDVIGKGTQDVLDYNTRIFRLSDANMERLSSAPLTSVEFNNTYKMFLTSSEDTTMALFKFGKKESTLLADCVFERFPISCAKFTTQGDRVILVAKKHYFKVYDMSSSSVTHPKIPFDAEYGECVSSVQISPQNEIGAFLGSYGMYIVDLRSYEKINTARVSGSAVAHCFSQDGNLLNAFSSDGSIFVFDMRKNTLPMHRWYDYSCVGGCSLAISNDSKYIACGSESGYVNIYTWKSVMKDLTKRPKPLKTVGNLVTAVDQLRFHPFGEMLYMSSSLEPGAARLYDIENQRVHASFPACMGRLGKPVSVGFSPRGGYLAVGQSGGRAALYCFDWCGSKY